MNPDGPQTRSEQEFLQHVLDLSAGIVRRRIRLRWIAAGTAAALAVAVSLPLALKGTTLPGRSTEAPIAGPPGIGRPGQPPAINTPETPTTCTCRPTGTTPTRRPGAPAPPKRPRPKPPTDTIIAFASDRGGNFDIYTMNARGSNVRRLTFDPLHDRDPAWSPDGKQIAFTRKVNLSDFFGEVWLMNADGSGQRRLTQGGGPKWSPDGKRIAYHALFGENVNVPLALWVINVDGSGKRMVTDSGSDPTWTPDGKHLVYGGILGPLVSVWKVPVAGGAAKERLYDDPIFACMPDVSPDGRRIAYVTVEPGAVPFRTSLVVARAGDARGVSITDAPYWEYAPSWSPDGSVIAFERDPDIDPHYATYFGGAGPEGRSSWIVVARSDGSGEYEIRTGPYSDADPAFAPGRP